MAISPADFYAYSRATGVPVPDSDEERAQMAGDVINFRRNQLRAPAKQEDEGFNLTNALGIGAAALGLGAGALGLRSVLAKKAATAARTAEVPVAAQDVNQYQKGAPKYSENVANVAALKAEELPSRTAKPTAASESTTTAGIPKLIAPSATPEPSKTVDPWGMKPVSNENFAKSFLIDKGFVTEPADLWAEKIPDHERVRQEDVSNWAQIAVHNQTNAQLANAQAKLDERNPASASYVQRLADRQQRKAVANQQLAESIQTAMNSGKQQEQFDLNTNPHAVGDEAFQSAKQMEQTARPAAIAQEWREKLFDQQGMVRPEILATHLGDENVIPSDIAVRLAKSASTPTRGGLVPENASQQRGVVGAVGFGDVGAVLAATKHIRENLLAFDNQNTIKNYLVGNTQADAGDIQAAASKGLGWSTQSPSKTQVLTIATDKEGKRTGTLKASAPARYDRSDLEPLFYDEETGTLMSKDEIGATLAKKDPSLAESGTGIGAEIQKAVGFVPRSQLAPFVTSPGSSASGEQKFKGQGVGYAVGGVKELSDLEVGAVQHLPVLSTEEHIEKKNVGRSSYGRPWARVSPIALATDPRFIDRLNQEKGVFFNENPMTGLPWTSERQAADFVNKFHSQVNERFIDSAFNQLPLNETSPLPFAIQASRPVRMIRKLDAEGRPLMDDSGKYVMMEEEANLRAFVPGQKDRVRTNIIADPFTKIDSTTGATVASHLQDALLQKGILQEMQTEDGAKYIRQTRYARPMGMNEEEDVYTVLGLGDVGLRQATLEKGKPNHYEYLQAVNNEYEALTGYRLGDLDNALAIGKAQVGVSRLGGPGKNPFLKKALIIANTLTQASENTTRVKVLNPDQKMENSLERIGMGTSQHTRPESPELAAELNTVHLVKNNSTGQVQQMTLREMQALNNPGTATGVRPLGEEIASLRARPQRTLSALEQSPELMADVYPELQRQQDAKTALAKLRGNVTRHQNEWADTGNVSASEANAMYQGTKALSEFEEAQNAANPATARPEAEFVPAYEEIGVQYPGVELSRQEIYNIQNPGGKFRQDLESRSLEKARERGRLLGAAEQTPGGRLKQGAVNLPIGSRSGMVLRAQSPDMPESAAGQFPQWMQSLAEEPTSSSQVRSIPAGLGDLSESEVIRRYGASSGQLKSVADNLMAQAAYKKGQQPGPTVNRAGDLGAPQTQRYMSTQMIPTSLREARSQVVGYTPDPMDAVEAYMASKAPSEMKQRVMANVRQSANERLARTMNQMRLPIF